jgi:NSS family neurotransmitter:Na+ symporter
MIAYASYLPKKSSIVRDSVAICGINSLFSLIAGFGVFAIIGYMSQATGKPIEKVVDNPIGLAFVVYPQAITLLPAFSNLFGILFFGSLVIAGLSSSISIIEAFTAGVIDKFHYSRKVVTSVLAILGFLGGIIFTTQAGLYWLDIVDHFLNHYGLIVVGFFECIVVAWVYQSRKLRQHINNYSEWTIGKVWGFCVKVIVPIVLLFLLISSLADELKAPYGGYSRLAVILIGRDWLLGTFFAAIIISLRPWRVEPKERNLS